MVILACLDCAIITDDAHNIRNNTVTQAAHTRRQPEKLKHYYYYYLRGRRNDPPAGGDTMKLVRSCQS